MSFLSGKPTTGSQIQRPTIQRVSRPAPKPAASPIPSVANVQPPKSQTSHDRKPVRPVSDSTPPASREDSDRYKLSTAPSKAKTKSSHKPGSASSSSLKPPRHSDKRKSFSPSTKPLRSDSEGESDGDLLEDRRYAKKPRIDAAPLVDTKRTIRAATPKDDGDAHDSNTRDLIHSIRIVDAAAKGKFYGAFDDDKDAQRAEVLLQYPNAPVLEKFPLVTPTESDEYRPIEDLAETMTIVLKYYLPETQSETLLDPSTGLIFRLRKAIRSRSHDDLQSVVLEYNKVVQAAMKDGTISSQLDSIRSLPLAWVERVLDQIYARTVGPQVDSLRKYEAFSDNTYGELKPQFISQIFRDTGLDSSATFLDMGSGIGNVVLQAALEVGCASYGIEVMENPSNLAQAQAAEFPRRCKIWGVAPGLVEIWKGDFLEDSRVNAVLAKVDVVLVNNQAFQPDLNAQLIQRFLDLKEGAKVVSLKSFVPHGWKLNERTRDNIIGMFDVKQHEYWSGSVSWKGEGGQYYVATKDSQRIERILGRQSGRKSRG